MDKNVSTVRYVALHPDMRTGYGQAALGNLYALGLAGEKPEVQWLVEGTGWGRYLEPEDGAGLQRETVDVLIVHTVADYIDAVIREFPARKTIAVTVWDTEQLPPRWTTALNLVDCIVVPCEWNRKIFPQFGVTPRMETVPHLLTGNTTEQTPHEIAGLSSDDFVFYTVGTWGDRKGTARVVEAFCQEFHSEPRAVLVVKTGEINELSRRWGRWWWHVTRRIDSARKDLERVRRKAGRDARVVCIDRDLDDTYISGIHARGDCYVSMARSEGWGMGAFDAANRGTPVVMPLFGGQTDYLDPELCFPVHFDVVDAQPLGAVDAEVFASGQRWAHPDLADCRRQMRHVFTHREEAREKAAQLARSVRERFDPLACGQHFARIIREVAEQE